MQHNNKCVIPPPPPPIQWSSALAPTIMTYSMKPIQPNYIVPPPPPPPPPPPLPPPPPPPPPSFQQFSSKEFNSVLQSYPTLQNYGSLSKEYPVPESTKNISYEVTNSCSKADTTLPLQGSGLAKHDSPQVHTFETPTFENVSPTIEGGQSWTGASEDEIIEGVATTKHEQKKKPVDKHDKTRGLTLLREKVIELVREILKPKWREGIITKEAFKIIAKKAVDKVLGTVKPPLIPNTVEKVATYMTAARPKILKLVQGYVDKYARD
ncbi:hypothetical protein KC19_4G141200 [Ceratodon purpureus]|uniref:SFR19-like C-terminal domain-containing protein n=1 Tax=Ceratodon purpureus TaxID=3225 RepID=A0A8T0I9F9_CERPU|nr:hypothetical protein KC19_4G141200 [Ceratodon purpureus]